MSLSRIIRLHSFRILDELDFSISTVVFAKKYKIPKANKIIEVFPGMVFILRDEKLIAIDAIGEDDAVEFDPDNFKKNFPFDDNVLELKKLGRKFTPAEDGLSWIELENL